MLVGNQGCVLLFIARASFTEAPKRGAGPSACGNQGRVFLCIMRKLGLSACYLFTEAEGRKQCSWLEHGAMVAAEGHTWCSGQGKWLRGSAAWLGLLGSLPTAREEQTFFRNQLFWREMSQQL